MNTAVVKRCNSDDEYTVSLRCRLGETFAMRVSPDCEYDLENCSKQLAESVCYSGIFYARRALESRKIDVEILRIAGRSQPGYVEGFAIAAFHAIACALGKEKRGLELIAEVSEASKESVESAEWEVVSP